MTRTPYVPPPLDAEAPLDEIQQAIVRALVPVIAEAIRQELIEEQEQAVERNDDTEISAGIPAEIRGGER